MLNMGCLGSRRIAQHRQPTILPYSLTERRRAHVQLHIHTSPATSGTFELQCQQRDRAHRYLHQWFDICVCVKYEGTRQPCHSGVSRQPQPPQESAGRTCWGLHYRRELFGFVSMGLEVHTSQDKRESRWGLAHQLQCSYTASFPHHQRLTM